MPPRPVPRIRCLAGALACALAGAQTLAAAAPPRDTSWIRLRNDPAHRLFATLPAPRKIPRELALHRPHALLPVSNCNDDGPGSLRAAVDAAGNGDTVDLSQLQCSTITLDTGAIGVALDDLNIVGPGARQLAIDGRGADRIFVHPYGGTLSLRGLTLRNGSARANGFHVTGGGCIASAGYVQLYASSVHDCYARAIGSYGGALYAYALTMADSTMRDNRAYAAHPDAGTAAFGGAVFVYSLQVVNSTISGNRADHRDNPGHSSYDIGGAFALVNGGSFVASTISANVSGGRGGGVATFSPLSISNSTISGNFARRDIAGGLFLRWPATLELTNSTVTANRAALDGGGIWLNANGSGLRSSIVFGNSTDIGNRNDYHGVPHPAVIAGSNNLVGNAAPDLSLPADTLHTDPLLRPLANNGGLTLTHALASASPAIDRGSNPLNLPSDQRGSGFIRSYGSAPDIGAYEFDPRTQPSGSPLGIPATSRPALLWLGAGLAAIAAAVLRRSSHLRSARNPARGNSPRRRRD